LREVELDPRLLEDRFEIERQLFHYAYTYDTGDADGWARLFTEDGIWEAVHLGEEDSPSVSLKGHEELSAFVRGSPASRPGVRALHHQGSVVFDELSANTARTRSMVLVTLQVPETVQPHVMRHGVYFDQWVKSSAGWQIAHRRFVSYQQRR
jgi:hypothetical protein